MTKELETTKPMVLCLTVVRAKRRISSIMRICETRKALYFGPSIGAIGMSLFATLLFVGTIALSLWASIRVRQVYGKFSRLPASSGLTGAEITLPVEFDASARARLVLKQTGLVRTGEEETAVAKVPQAAAWSYIAAFVTSLGYFLLHLLPLIAGRKE